MGVFSRVFGIFFEPKKTFEDIARKPNWLVPVLLLMLASACFMTMFNQRVGWERFMRHQFEISSRAQQLTPEQRERAIATRSRMGPVLGYGGIVIGLPLYLLIAAAVLLGTAAGIMSAPLKFAQVFAIVCYSNLPGVVTSALGIVVMLLKNPDDFDLQNPLLFNAGAFLDPEHGSKFLYSLATSLDLFAFWIILLIATGLKAAAGKRLSFGGALFAVVLPWAVWVLVKAGFAGMFS
jgi:hypothetical protein